MLKYSVFQEIIAELKDSVKKNNLQANILSRNRKQNSEKKKKFFSITCVRDFVFYTMVLSVPDQEFLFDLDWISILEYRIFRNPQFAY